MSLAHGGVLFLDELPEFRSSVLEVLRQPLEDGTVTLSRAAMSLTYPARIMLAAAMNPCPCGYSGDPAHACLCPPQAVQRYRARVSGPLLDRIDIHLEVPAIPYRDLTGRPARRNRAASLRSGWNGRVAAQRERFAGIAGMHANAHMGAREVRRFCALGAESESDPAIRDHPARACRRARTTGCSRLPGPSPTSRAPSALEVAHVAEAIQYRSLDRGQPALVPLAEGADSRPPEAMPLPPHRPTRFLPSSQAHIP